MASQLKLPPGLATRDLVTLAAHALDRFWPRELTDGKEWWQFVTMTQLQMENGCQCVCGQLGIGLAAFTPEHIKVETSNHYIIVTGDRGITRDMSGFDVFTNSPESIGRIERVFTEWLWEQLNIGLWLDNELRRAFNSETPAQFWKEEIRARRRRSRQAA